jgi:hypothetical protein
VPVGREQVAADTLEVAVNPFQLRDGFDAVDRRPVAVVRETRPLDAVQPHHLDIAVVDLVGEVRCRDARLPAPRSAVIEDDDRLSFTREQVRGGQTRDARADDADVRARV